MGKPITIDPSKVAPGDIVLIANTFRPFSIVERIIIGGWRNAFRRDWATHIAVIADRGHGLNYMIEMTYKVFGKCKGIRFREIHKANTHGDRVVGIKRHPMVYKLADKANDYLLESHARQVKYDFPKGLLEFWLPTIKDDPDKWICSELPMQVMKRLHVPYPKAWDKRVAPRDIQVHIEFKDVCMGESD